MACWQITSAEGTAAEPQCGKNRAAEVPSRLGNPYCFLATGHPLGKFPEFCEAQATNQLRERTEGSSMPAEALMAPGRLQRLPRSA